MAALGREYYQISYIPVTTTSPNVVGLDAYAVVATQNNTVLSHNEEYIATLDSGQVYYKTSSTDMTGAHITSNNPVSFFSIATFATVPYPSGYSDFFMQQLAPVHTWGKSFFVPVTIFEKDIVRIVASQDSTNIKPTGGTIRIGVPDAQTTLTNLQAGQFVELDINLTNNGCYILSDKPVGVCSYTANALYTGFPSAPAQAWIPGIEQTVPQILMAPFITNTFTYLSQHYALVVTSKATKNSTTVSVGGALPTVLSGVSWYDNDTAGISFYSMPLDDPSVSYIFSNSAGIIVLGYASGPIGETRGSYYYLAGSAMRTLDAAFYVNDIHYEDLKDTTFCSNHINFRAEIENMGVEMDSLKWYINGIEKYTKLNHLEWDTTLSNGTYEIKMWVRFKNDTIITRIGTLKIVSCSANSATFYVNNIPYNNLQDTVFCDKNVNFRAEIEGLNSNAGSLKWYIDEVPEPSAQDHLEWSKELDTGDHKIKMEVLFANNNTETLTCILKMNVFWIKMRNVRY